MHINESFSLLSSEKGVGMGIVAHPAPLAEQVVSYYKRPACTSYCDIGMPTIVTPSSGCQSDNPYVVVNQVC